MSHVFEGDCMNAVKKDVKALLEKLPDDCTYEDIQYHLYVMSKIQNGITRAEVEGAVPQKDVEKKFKKWLAK
jgi:hypothetical protein